MTRDYDGVFYRVFCVTLLAIAFTFTVILTNVFIDIDDLLSLKGRAKSHSAPVTQINPNSLTINAEPQLDRYEDEDKDYEELDDNYRTKRSLESQNVLFHITNPKMKSVLTSRLAKLLEKLDEEETTPYIKNDKDTEKSKESIMKMVDDELLDDRNVKKHEQNTRLITDDNFLHLAMHNIVLQGIIEHMDINEIYKRIHSFMKNFKDFNNLNVEKSAMKLPPKLTSKGLSANEESKFFNELLNCKELQDQIMEVTEKYKVKEIARNPESHKGPKVLINTVIDIRSMLGDKVNKKNDTDSIDNIKGIIKLIYNGKSIKFDHMDDATIPPMTNTVKTTSTTQKIVTDETKVEVVSDSLEHNQARARKSFINKILNSYFKKLHKVDYSESAEMHQIKTKRLKRHVRIRYDNVETTTKHSKVKKNPKDDDELYVEIETNFDSKGTKDEKKRKLIKNLIEKIQKALHDPVGVNKRPDKKKKHKHLHVKKRTQDPLDNSKLSRRNAPEKIDAVIHRQLNPISKTVSSHEEVPNIYDSTGDSWKKTYTGPGFLAATKSINSAERNEVDTQYSKLINTNGIPQRMQRPLNTEGSNEDSVANSYFDLGNLKFIIKEIDGSGFSVGYNQYVDEPPDAETMKLFTGLENIIQTYHQKYDSAITGPEDIADGPNNDYEKPVNSKTEHVIARRSIKGHDYHSNEYKVIFDSDYLPYKNYQEIYDERKVHSVKDYNRKNLFTSKDMNAPFILDEDILKKDLKPAEIFGLANLLDRKKRGTNVKQILNLKSKIKMNKYLNTKTMASKKLFLNKKRIKRQINKIRIIASDSPHQQRQSDENIFFVSDENIFADRAIVREMRPNQVVEGSAGKIEEQHNDVLPPYVYEDSKEPRYITNVFDGKSRHNSLMSRYPHIFLDEVSRSKEQYLPDDNLMYDKTIPETPPDFIDTEQITTTQITEATENNNLLPIVDNVVSEPKSNYKLTVKILPKNISDSNPGFKEIHTSINESYKKNGMMYSSLVNVSEISKIIKLNKTKTRIQVTTISPIVKVVKGQQSKINKLLKQHRYRIDEQLQHLNKEKQRLETILASKKEIPTEGQSNELVDLVLSKDPLKVVRLPREQIAQLALQALSQTQGQYFETNNKITTAPPAIISTIVSTTSTYATTTRTTTTPTTTVTTTEVPTRTIEISRRSEMIGLDKMKILNTIEKNDKLTNEILKKIDKNAEILQTFLTKLLDSIPPHTTQKTMPLNDINVPSKINLNEPMSNWKDFQQIRDPFFFQPPPISDPQKFNTQVSIPFVYAYQQPYHVPDSKLKNPMQSVVYQGHIHTNTLTNKDKWTPNDIKPKPPNPVKNSNTIKRDVNQTRFFVDEIENDFKIIPQPLQKNAEILPVHVIATNVTTH